AEPGAGALWLVVLDQVALELPEERRRIAEAAGVVEVVGERGGLLRARVLRDAELATEDRQARVEDRLVAGIARELLARGDAAVLVVDVDVDRVELGARAPELGQE